jgi:hypothetical protein
MDSWPGAFAYLDDKVIKLYGASRALGAGVPGQVLSIDERGACVACGDKAVWVRELQLPGKRADDGSAAGVRPSVVGRLTAFVRASRERVIGDGRSTARAQDPQSHSA